MPIVRRFGLEKKISRYSYLRNNVAYLEEGADATLFLDTLKAKGIGYRFKEHITDGQSPIRDYPAYPSVTDADMGYHSIQEREGPPSDQRGTSDLDLHSLGQFIGTSEYHALPAFLKGLVVTDGVKYIMNNGYSWFVTDAASVIARPTTPLANYLKHDKFLSIKLYLQRKPDPREAEMVIDDGNGHVLYRQNYKMTDAKRELTLFYENGVLLLASEH